MRAAILVRRTKPITYAVMSAGCHACGDCRAPAPRSSRARPCRSRPCRRSTKTKRRLSGTASCGCNRCILGTRRHLFHWLKPCPDAGVALGSNFRIHVRVPQSRPTTPATSANRAATQAGGQRCWINAQAGTAKRGSFAAAGCCLRACSFALAARRSRQVTHEEESANGPSASKH